jgi:hypothetical protein
MCAAKFPARVTKRPPIELRVEEIHFVAEDGWSINGTLFCPPPQLNEVNSAQPRGVLINSATGKLHLPLKKPPEVHERMEGGSQSAERGRVSSAQRTENKARRWAQD